MSKKQPPKDHREILNKAFDVLMKRPKDDKRDIVLEKQNDKWVEVKDK